MNIQQMQYVIAVAENGSFREAAKHLYIAQPSLSQGIKELEQELSTELFQRTSKGAKLTEAGYFFYEQALAINKQFTALNEQFTAKDEPTYFAISGQHYDFIGVAMTALMKEFPHCQTIRILEGTTLEAINDVEAYRSELAVICLTPFNQAGLLQILDQQGLGYQVLTEFKTHIYLRQGHPLASQEAIHLHDLDHYSQVRFLQESSYTQLAEDPLAKPKTEAVISTSDRATLNGIIKNSDAYASGSGLVESPTEQGLVLVPLADAPTSQIIIVVRKNRPLTEMATRYLAKLEALF